MGLGLRQGLGVVVVLVGCLVGSQATVIEPSWPIPNIGIKLPYICPHEVTLTKLRMNQTESGYVQYVEYAKDIPQLTSFTMHYWFNLDDITTTSTMFNYASDPHPSGERLTVKLESLAGGRYQFWTIRMNGVESRVPVKPLLRRGQWYHALHSWNSYSGTIAHFLNGNLVLAQPNYKFKGLVVRGGGVAVSGQNQNTELFSGMDQGEGINGWFTLFQFSAKPIGIPSSSAAAIAKAKLASQCSTDTEGELINWTTTPRKGYGGVTATPSFSKACGHF